VYCNAERYNTFSPLPLIVLAGLSTRRRLVDLLSTKLLSPHLEADLQDSKEKEVMKNVEQEIECPRCSDIMTLSSDFDKLGYICQECELLLIMK
jgi:hypothetical protein